MTNPSKRSALASCVFVGMLFGASFWGKVSDAAGRRTAFILSAVVLLISGVTSSFAPNFATLVVLRTFVGFGVAGAHVAFSLFVEFLPARGRGITMLSIQAFWTVGSCLEVLIGWLALEKYTFASFAGWRVLLLATSAPVALVLCCAPLLPESPRWHLVKGKEAKALETLKRVAKANNRPLPAGARLVIGPLQESGRFLDLFSPKMLAITLTQFVLWFAQCCVYYGLILLAPSLLSKKKEPGHIDYMSLFIATVSEIPGIAMAVLLFIFFSRKASLATLLAFSTASVFLLLLYQHVSKRALLAVVTGARLFSSTCFSVIWVYTQELFPTTLRSQGVGSCSSFARVAGIVTPFIATNLFEINPHYPVFIYGACSAVCLAAVLLSRNPGKGLPDTISEADKSSSEHMPLLED